MKNSGVPWLGDVPAHWEVRRLRNAAEMRVSNVDKHSKEEEEPVRLCNYVDVYKNDRIRDGMPFMRATATGDEIARFRLAVGDVLITKDSEVWNDIGVPALVVQPADDLVCGYHLALLRPFTERIIGDYLFRVMQSNGVAYQFHVEANGVTRYGLSHSAIKSIWLPTPPRPEQAAIVRFLDHAERRIRRCIRAKQKLIKLLEEQKQAIIHRAVTRGLDPNVRLKPSEVDWLGDVPEHWDVVALKYLSRRVQNGATPPTSETSFYENGTVPWYGPSSCGKREQVTTPVRYLTEAAFLTGRGRLLCGPALLVVVIGATAGRMALLLQDGATNQQITSYELRTERVHPRFILHQLRGAERWLRSTASTATIPILDAGLVSRLPVATTSLAEQESILSYADEATGDLTRATDRAWRDTELLREYRTRLIADVVTGKLDVREAAADEAEELEPLDEPEVEAAVEEDATDDLGDVPGEAEA
jgi:type I restriction enzyme, S subunit